VHEHVAAAEERGQLGRAQIGDAALEPGVLELGLAEVEGEDVLDLGIGEQRGQERPADHARRSGDRHAHADASAGEWSPDARASNTRVAMPQRPGLYLAPSDMVSSRRAMLDPNQLAQWGLPGLFVTALLAGSVFPLPTEALVSALVLGGQHLALVLGVALLGNVLGSTTLYVLGGWVARGGGGPIGRWLQRRSEKEGPRLEKAKEKLRHVGAPALLFCSIPIAGDAVILAAGFVGVRPLPFVVFVALGKGLRYGAVALSTAAALAAAHG
jgi:membrane protein YqaA with SNARE-associated domain